eukprot:GEMP01051845.1.p1 GENE.GEMP01051845.1~~GEMP01051845.1.p1  ORF type:complete len:222 (+),score=49.73 GEMP01051845.1:187-852(+)
MSTAHYGRAVPVAMRRFGRIQIVPVNAPKEPLTLPADLPSGMHCVILLTRLKHIANLDSWLGVREAIDRLMQEQSSVAQVDGEMNMYVCCMLPWFWPWRLLWRYKAWKWQEKLAENEFEKVTLYTAVIDRERFLENMCIHNDGRSYGLIIQSDGEIMWCSHDGFEPEQERGVIKVIREEIVYRETRAERLLEGAPEKRLEGKEHEPLLSSRDQKAQESTPL